MNILITGGTGFIGKALVSFLKEKGFSPAVLARHRDNLDIQDLEFIQCDIMDPSALNSVLKDRDIVFHLTASTDERLSYSRLYEVNVTGTKNVLEACIKNNIRHLIFTSTIGVLGPSKKEGTKESDPYNPQTPYERAKCEAERLVLDYTRTSELSVTILRPTMVYGPDERWLKVFKQVKKGIPVIGKGSNYWHLVYVKDVAEALFLAMERKGPSGEIYNIADDDPLTYKQVYDTARECLSLPPIDKHIPVWMANIFAFLNESYATLKKENPILTRAHIKRLIRQRIIDISKAEKELLYKPRYRLKEGFKETIDLFKKQGLL